MSKLRTTRTDKNTLTYIQKKCIVILFNFVWFKVKNIEIFQKKNI